MTEAHYTSIRSSERYWTPPPPAPPADVRPGHAIWFCRCGAVYPDPYRDGPFDRHAPVWVALARWQEEHAERPHRALRDEYRASCLPHIGGCRNCGTMPVWPKQFYCSDQCRETFEADHFWDSARGYTVTRNSIYPVGDGRFTYHRPTATRCERCDELIPWAYPSAVEVNHIAPLNGIRPHFGCVHHQSNLEVLCRPCHHETTAEQRRLGLIR